MPELKKGEPCLLWQKTRVLARDLGYIMSPSCPLEEYCSGTKCEMMVPIAKTADEVEKFYRDLDTESASLKIDELRAELKLLE